MTLYTKCIYSEAEESDGTRISVMSRHTLNDGKTIDTKIVEGISFKEHLKGLGPPASLVGGYYKGRFEWPEFEKGYKMYLQLPKVAIKVKELAKRALTEDITILCKEDTPERCHRRLLAEECKRYGPGLEVVIR